VLNYVDGPLQDVDRTGHVWIFGKTIRGVQVYIKLKIADDDGTDWPMCISFHQAERPMRFPFTE
jgi:hypothetical protein